LYRVHITNAQRRLHVLKKKAEKANQPSLISEALPREEEGGGPAV
jgi:hypothetical protein